ncbi:MAG TPA: ATP-grasp domain-containing protein [Candidatus Acidoferrales bacterium]|nr:ATP-grasp domain-containing protein [Candidatus Acidoferrales bacterium]
MRIMISAGGTVTAQSVVKALREDGRAAYIAVCDMDELTATKAFVDDFVLVPPASSPAFGAACLDAVRRAGIELFVPLIVEREFLPLAALRKEFAAAGCRLWVPPERIVEAIGDKLAFAGFLRERNIPSPETAAVHGDLVWDRFPAYVKPRRGSGSVGTTRVEGARAYRDAIAGREDLIVQEALSGREFTVDCFASHPGRVVAAVPRERIAIKAGVSVKGRTYRDETIERIAADVVEKSGLVGPANVQGMLAGDGSFSIIEMNPRFSGTLALTTAAGINFAGLLLDCVQGIDVPDLRGRHLAGVSMARYWSEVFEMPDGSLRPGTPLGARTGDEPTYSIV